MANNTLDERAGAIEQYQRGIVLKSQFHATGNLDYLNQSISFLNGAVAASGDVLDPEMPEWYNTLGEALWFRSERTGSLPDIGGAISAFQKAVDLCGENHPRLPLWMSNIALVLQSRSQRTGDFRDLAEAISLLQSAANLTSEGDASLLNILNNLGFAYQCRFNHLGNLDDLSEALSVQRKALNLTPPDSSALPIMLSNLGTTLQSRFKLTGDLADITESISTLEQAVDVSPEGDPSVPTTLSNLGLSRRYRSERTGDPSDLDEAILDLQEAVELYPEGHVHLPTCLDNLALTLQTRFQRAGKPDDIAESISLLKRAMELTPEGNPLVITLLNNYGLSMQMRSTVTGDTADITEAITAQKKAIALTPANHSDLPVWLSNLGISFLSRFKLTGDLQDIKDSTSHLRQAADITPAGHPGLANTLNNLGLALRHRFELAGDLSDIADAILALQKTVNLAPDGHAHLPFWLSNQGLAFQSRFKVTEDLYDLTEAVSAFRKSVDLTPSGHAELPLRLCNLGLALRSQFERTHDISTISEAIAAARKAVSHTAMDHTDLPIMLSNVASSLQSRFKLTRHLEDINEAIETQHSAIRLTPDGHASMPTTLSNLALSFYLKFELTADASDVSRAISTAQKAIDLTPEGDSSLPTMWYTLAKSLRSRFSLSNGSRDDLDASLTILKRVATCTYASPAMRLEAGSNWARDLYRHHPTSPETLAAYDTTISQASLMAGLHQTLRRRYHHLQGIARKSVSAAEAAAAAFQLGRPDKAVEWLEHGRCLVWNQLSMLRSPVDELRLHNSDLADKIAGVSRRLEHASSSRAQSRFDMPLSEKISLEGEAREHLSLAKEWDDLLGTVRAIPGFESFLQPSSNQSLLQHLPSSGFVVIINVHEHRCDAVALSAGQTSPLHIPLPGFSLKKAIAYSRMFTTQLYTLGLRLRGDSEASLEGEFEEQDMEEEEDVGRAMARYNRRKDMRKNVVHDTLRNLWNEVVKPVLDALKLQKANTSSVESLPRIWWSPTGPLSFLPIHAAGVYGTGEHNSTVDYAVSSYIPTVGALTSRVRDELNYAPYRSFSGLFLTSQPNAPGASAIPGTAAEVAAIYEVATQMGIRVSKVDGDDLSIDGCLQMMEDFSSIHLACHASQHTIDPLRSRFLFHQGSLDLGRIVQRNLKNADLAFLSACQTSAGDETLSDEAVHLASGMLAAGYRRVVATMWAISDHHAPGVAKELYQHLWDHPKEGLEGAFDGSNSAYALHHSIQRLREKIGDSESSILAWAAYVHFGF